MQIHQSLHLTQNCISWLSKPQAIVDKHVGWRNRDYAITQAVRKYLCTKVCWTGNTAILLQTLTYTSYTLFSIYQLNRLFVWHSLCPSLHFKGIVHQKLKMSSSKLLSSFTHPHVISSCMTFSFCEIQNNTF